MRTVLTRLLVPAAVLASVLVGVRAPDAAAAPVPLPGPARVYVGNAPGDVVGFDSGGNRVRRVPTQFGGGDVMIVGDFDGNSIDDFAYGDAQSGDIVLHMREGFVGLLEGTGFDVDPGATDALAAGDVNGDGTDEILVAHAPQGTVVALDPSGDEVARIEGTGFDSDVTGGPDRFAAGDLDGDGSDEVVVANAPSGDLVAFDRTGAHVATVGSGFDSDGGGGADGFAVGDVTGDLAEELLVANAPSGDVIALSRAGGPPVKTWETGFDSDLGTADRVAAGDVDSDGFGDVVIAEAPSGNLVSYLGSGGTLLVEDSGFDSEAGNPDAFAVTDTARDVDGDAIRDRVERRGIHTAAGAQLLAPSDPCRETINVEIDYMQGPQQLFTPDPKGLNDTAAAFDQAPRPAAAHCPYPGPPSRPGIELRWWLSEALPSTGPVGSRESFAAIRAAHFQPVLDRYVHYSVWADEVVDPGTGQQIGGRCCYGPAGKDFLAESQGDALEQGTTFMHELGHALGLGHGGGDDINEKPNYFSVMNYWFSHTGLHDDAVRTPGGDLIGLYDFSRLPLPAALDESRLSEPAGIGAHRRFFTKFRDAAGVEQPAVRVGPGDPVDWDGDQTPDETAVPLNVNADLNGYCVGPGANGQLDSTAAQQDLTQGGYVRAAGNFSCDTPAIGDDVQLGAVGTAPKLTSHDDWAAIRFGGGQPGSVPADHPEPSNAQVQQTVEAWDRDLVPDRTVSLAPARPGFHASVHGLAVDGDRLFATHHYTTVASPFTSDRPGSLVVLDRAALKVVGRVQVGFIPRSVAVNPVTKRVYVLSGTDPADPTKSRITVVDRTSLAVLARVDFVTGQATADIAVNPRTNRVYVSNTSADRLHVFDGGTNQELAPILVGPGPVGLAVDAGRNTVFAALSKRGGPDPEVAALGSVVDDGVNRTVNPPVSLGEPLTQPRDVAVDPERGRVYVANLGGGGVAPSLTALDRDTRAILGRVPAAGPSRAVAVNPYAHRVFLASEGDSATVDTDHLRVLRTSRPGVAFSVATDAGPGRQVYYGDLHAGTVTRLSHSSGEPA